MSDKITVFVITGDSKTVLNSVKEMVASGAVAIKAPTETKAIAAPAVLSLHKTKCTDVPFSKLYIKPAAEFLAGVGNGIVRFSEMLKFINKKVGSMPSNRELSSFLRNNNYIRLRQTIDSKSTFFWVKKGSVYALGISK